MNAAMNWNSDEGCSDVLFSDRWYPKSSGGQVWNAGNAQGIQRVLTSSYNLCTSTTDAIPPDAVLLYITRRVCTLM